MFALARQTHDALPKWPTRLAALMAARLKVDPHLLQTELDEVQEHLSALATVDVERVIATPSRR